MICKNCGAQIDDNSKECKFCGEVFDDEQSTDETKVIDTDAVNEEIQEEEMPPEALGQEYSGEDIDKLFDENEKNRKRQFERINAEKQKQLREIEKRREDKKKKQRRNKALISLAALLCVGGAGVGIYHIQTNRDRTPDVVITTPSPSAAVVTTPEVTEVSETEDPANSPEPSTTPVTASSWTPSDSGSTSGANTANTPKTNSASGNNASSGNSAVSTKSTDKTSNVSSSASANTGVTSAGSGTVKTSTANVAGKEYSAKGGYDGTYFTAALITGSEVVKNGDKSYMVFKHNGNVYYANISSNTTTSAISGRPMTINAFKTSEVYNGSNVYEITAITNYNGNYIFPESGYRQLTEADLANKTAKELLLGRNEIYARHGRQFKIKEIQDYFNSCSWYKVKSNYDYSNDANNLNSIERLNADLIKKYEESHK